MTDHTLAAVDWRTEYDEHLAFALGAAFGAGVILGVASARVHDSRPHFSRRSIVDVLDPSGEAAQQIGEIWDDVLGAAIAAAGAALIATMSDLIPGFNDQFVTRVRPRQP